jgi:hypothetical protein
VARTCRSDAITFSVHAFVCDGTLTFLSGDLTGRLHTFSVERSGLSRTIAGSARRGQLRTKKVPIRCARTLEFCVERICSLSPPLTFYIAYKP